jgi:hypothetical protein
LRKVAATPRKIKHHCSRCHHKLRLRNFFRG